MNKKLRLPLSVAVALVAVAIFALAGLPLAQLNVSSVQAAYGPSAESMCAGTVTYQLRLTGDVQSYADAALTQPAILLKQNGLGKWLVCDSSLTATVYKLFVGSNNAVYVVKTAGNLAFRNLRDNQ
jgi:hypothetical protein